jgi:HD superfamily phosphodiesterase
MSLERAQQSAKQLLLLPIDETRQDPWLWEHATRVAQSAQTLGAWPELGGRSPDPTVLAVAGLFHDAGWALECRQGRYARRQVLTRPTNDLQRELAAAVLLEELNTLLPGPVLRQAGEAIRQCNDRRTTLLEARVLADADALDEMGMAYVMRQFRQYEAEGRPLQQLVDTWQRQKEYRYWEVRLADGFHWDLTRTLARARLASIDAFMQALARDLAGADLTDHVQVPLAAPAAPTT